MARGLHAPLDGDVPHRDRGGAIKIRIWLVTRERETWITGAEILALGLLLVAGPGSLIRLGVGLPLLVHLGYTALTSLPMGKVPGRPEKGQLRRNLDLRSRTVLFLSEVRRLDDYAQRARDQRWPRSEVEKYLHPLESRMMAAAAEVAKAARREAAAPPSRRAVTEADAGAT
jgi:hypothetical protein